jgi:hypothetical protein
MILIVCKTIKEVKCYFQNGVRPFVCERANSVDNLESGQGITLYMDQSSRLLRIKRENWKNISSLLIFFIFPGYQQLFIDNMEVYKTMIK